MCGIAGIWNFENNAPADREILNRMVSVLHHRGPDDRGTWLSGGIGLGHARLSIVDLSGGHQPMANEDDTLWIVFNGEIFNYPELRSELLKKGHSFRTTCDTEVILHQYEELGEKCVDTFNGQFAFAIWDSKSKNLFLARDRMGIRPLFYVYDRKRIIWGSEIKAIFADPTVSRDLDPMAIDQTFTFWFPISPRTGFKSVQELPPGHTMSVSEGGIQIRRYWQIPFAPEEETAQQTHPDEWYSQSLLELLEDSVRIRLRADVTVGAYLSGGLDSSVIGALALKHVQERLKTFSIAFQAEYFDETIPQSRIVKHLGTEHHRFFCRTSDVGNGFEKALWHAERPLIRTAPVPMMFLSDSVRKSGIKVVLTGEGADEILAGYDIFKETKIRRFWAKYPDSQFRPLLLRRLYPYLPNMQTQSSGYLKAFFGLGLTDTSDPFYSHRLRWKVTSASKRFYSEDMKKTLQDYDPVEELRDQLPDEFARWDYLSQAQYLEAAFLLPGYILSSQGDRMGMANAVEGRFPFLDHRVVEFAGRIPNRLKLKSLIEKHVLREGASTLLPPEVLERAKQPYRAPDHHAFFQNKQPYDFVSEALSRQSINSAGYFSSESVAKLLLKAQRSEALGTAEGMALTGLLSVQLLCRQFMNQT